MLAGVSRADSSRLRRSAESAQRSFESFRRSRFPVRAGDGGGSCDVRVGRYCYWRGDDADEAPAPEDPPDVKKRRDALIAQLDSTSERLSGDAWVAGQLVRYFVDAHRTDDAIRYATTRCDAGRAWCAALAGFAAHADKRYAVADSEFHVALAAMDSPSGADGSTSPICSTVRSPIDSSTRRARRAIRSPVKSFGSARRCTR